jgi:putative Holliday junction resolvase
VAISLFNMADLRDGLGPGERLLGLDLGSRTIGIALSDVGLRLASPFGSIARGKLRGIVPALLRIAHAENVGGLVVGLPLDMDDGYGPAAQAARDWAHAISRETELPTALWDERMTTSETHEVLIERMDMTRARRAAVIDRMAAAAILQSALDATAPP